MSSAIEQAIQSNRQYTSSFNLGSLKAPPQKHLAIVTCMDARIVPHKVLGLKEGDAHVIANAGGRYYDAERSLIISQTFLGTREVLFLHHTDCGMQTFNDNDIRSKLRSERNVNADHIAFLPFNDLEQSVRDDITAYHQSPLTLKGIPVRGVIYDVKTGQVHEVKP